MDQQTGTDVKPVIRVQVSADLPAGHGLTHDDVYQAVVETLTAWVADERTNTLNPRNLPTEGTHTLIESIQLLSNTDRYKAFPAALDEHRRRRTQRRTQRRTLYELVPELWNAARP